MEVDQLAPQVAAIQALEDAANNFEDETVKAAAHGYLSHVRNLFETWQTSIGFV